MTATGTTSGTATDGDAWPGSRDVLRAVAAREDPHDSGLGDLAIAYYAGVPAHELAARPAEALAIVRAHRSLARLHVPGIRSRRCSALGAETDPGWARPIRTACSVLVVTDDMPYLIDSVIAELSRTGTVSTASCTR